ncbi:MAG: hypothetical protein PVI40_04105 [Chlamydiota bacterium]|jgi:hypothetical protein
MTTDLFLNTPEYFHRDYNNDLPQQSNSNFFTQAQRVALVALPFISLYKPLGKTLTIGAGSIRVVSSSVELVSAIKASNAQSVGKTALDVTLAVCSVAGTILLHPLGMLITTGHDLTLNGYHLYQAIAEGNRDNAVQEVLQLANNAFYLLTIVNGSMGYQVLSLTCQVVLGGYSSLKEFNAGNYLEGTGHAFMAAIRGHQLHSQYQSWQLQRGLNPTGLLPEVETHEEAPKEFVDQIEKAIMSEDLDTFQQLQQSSDWNNLSQRSLERLTYNLSEYMVYSQNDRDQVYLTMLQAVIQHPNNDLSLQCLKYSLDNACVFGHIDLFKCLLDSSTASKKFSEEHLLSLLENVNFLPPNLGCRSAAYLDSVLQGKKEIFETLQQHPNWNKDSPEFLTKAFCFLTRGDISSQIRMNAIKSLQSYPAWSKLTSQHLVKIAGYRLSFGGNGEMAKFTFNLLYHHPSWNNINSERLSEIARKVSSSHINPNCFEDALARMRIIELLAKHPSWEKLRSDHLMNISIETLSGGEGGYEVLQFLSTHPNWEKMSFHQFYYVVQEFYRAYEIYGNPFEVLKEHPMWRKLDKQSLAEFAGSAANRSRPDRLEFLANHPNWNQLDKKDFLEILEWSYWSWKIPKILEIFSKHPVWGEITKDDLKAFGLEEWFDKF